MFRHSLVGALLIGLIVPALAVGAAIRYSGSRNDASGDAPSYGDIRRVSATYDSSGHLTARLRLASYSEAAARRTVVGGFFARVRHGRCDKSSGAGMSLETDTKVAEGGVASHGHATSMPARAIVSGNTIRLSLHGRAVKNLRLNCFLGGTLVPTGPTTSRTLDKLVMRLRPRASLSRRLDG